MKKGVCAKRIWESFEKSIYHADLFHKTKMTGIATKGQKLFCQMNFGTSFKNSELRTLFTNSDHIYKIGRRLKNMF